MKKEKIVVIVGPTASGKTSLSIELAKEFNGEIVSADSRQVYRGLDIGTGKITKEEMQEIPHHLLDVANPTDTYSVSDFVRDARDTISSIVNRKKIPIVVGGTFFYIDALLGKISTPEVPPNHELRAKLEEMSADSLYTVLLQNDESRAADIDPQNKRRIIRALEIVEAIGKVPEIKPMLIYNALTIGIDIPKSKLHKNIHDRIESRMKIGMIEEVEELHKNGMTFERMEELGLEYRYISLYLQKKITKAEMLKELEIKTRQFAKRQMTWLKRNKSINWFSLVDKDEISVEIERFLKNSD